MLAINEFEPSTRLAASSHRVTIEMINVTQILLVGLYLLVLAMD